MNPLPDDWTFAHLVMLQAFPRPGQPPRTLNPQMKADNRRMVEDLIRWGYLTVTTGDGVEIARQSARGEMVMLQYGLPRAPKRRKARV